MYKSIDEKKDALISELQKFKDKDERLRHIIAKGKGMPEIDRAKCEDRYLVPGCLSKAWLVPEFKDGRVHFGGDSEAMIVKGVMALLLEVYSGNEPQENLRLAPDFLAKVGVTEHLSMNRRNGLANLCKQIQLYSAAFQAMLKN